MACNRIPISRRAFLAGTAGALVAPAAASAATPRIAVIDWAMLETVLALGIVPVAAAELIQFRKIVIEPDVPATVSDLGLRGAPNYELLRTLSPDIILISNFYEPKRRQFERIAPVMSRLVYQTGEAPYPLAVDAMRAVGDRFGHSRTASRYIAETEAEIAHLRAELASVAQRPVFAIILGDTRHLQAFGQDSMFGDVMGRLGIVNAWPHGTQYSAAAPVGLEALATRPDAAVVIISPLPPDFRRGEAANALWQALPAVRHGRVAVLPSVNHFGGLPSARRFARLFSAAMLEMPANE